MAKDYCRKDDELDFVKEFICPIVIKCFETDYLWLRRECFVSQLFDLQDEMLESIDNERLDKFEKTLGKTIKICDDVMLGYYDLFLSRNPDSYQLKTGE